MNLDAALNWFSTNFVSLMEAIAWPAAIILILWLYRGIFANLLFSVNEYNFFGAKGKVKSVKKVVEESVENELRRREQETKDRKQIKLILSEKKDTEEAFGQIEEAFGEAYKKLRKLEEENRKLKKGETTFVRELQSQITALLGQIATLQKILSEEDGKK